MSQPYGFCPKPNGKRIELRIFGGITFLREQTAVGSTTWTNWWCPFPTFDETHGLVDSGALADCGPSGRAALRIGNTAYSSTFASSELSGGAWSWPVAD